jgi:prolyl oligopeptidase
MRHLDVRSVLLVFISLVGCLALTACKCGYCARSNPSSKAASQVSTNDPFLWLEDVTGDKALGWVREQNVLSTQELTNRPGFDTLRQRLLSIYDSKERIPMASKLGPYLYNFWRDDQHVRGILRRTSLKEYRKPQPAWETVLDLDRLAETEKENWVWAGFDTLHPDHERCLVSLSRGGADASVVRE